jgi:hypothetical protein
MACVAVLAAGWLLLLLLLLLQLLLLRWCALCGGGGATYHVGETRRVARDPDVQRLGKLGHCLVNLLVLRERGRTRET